MEPSYGEELESVLEYLIDEAESYVAERFQTPTEVRREDFGTGIYWTCDGLNRFVLMTAFNEYRMYVTADAKTADEERTVELKFASLEEVYNVLDAARGTAEGLEPPFQTGF